MAAVCAAWILLLLACIAGVFRFLIAGEWLLLIQFLVAISFTVSLAYFCAAFTKKRMFEILYPVIWYVGPIQTVLYLDFFGVNIKISWDTGIPYYFMAITIGLLTLDFKNTR
jgi:hypothetical protein